MPITMTDFFCGAGGTTDGALRVPGVEVKYAINHWQQAIDTHSLNHPEADHFVSDIQTTPPSYYPATDIAWLSPSCTFHSSARGAKIKGRHQLSFWNDEFDPEAERSRATMREVVDMSAYHRYKYVIVENVVNVRDWEFYHDWWDAMVDLGYQGKTVYLNSMFFDVPQSRDRWYTVWWRNDMHAPDLDFRPRAYCEHCDKQVNAVQVWKNPEKQYGKYGSRNQYLYRCPDCYKRVHPFVNGAYTVIDWTLPTPTIGSRKKPLVPKTIERIRAGLEKLRRQAMTYQLSYNGKVSSIDNPMRTQTTRQDQALYLSPFVMSYYTREAAQSLDNPLPTIPTENRHALMVPYYHTVPPRGLDQPLGTLTASGTHEYLLDAHPAIMAYYNNAVMKDANEPMPTLRTKDSHALLMFPTDTQITNEFIMESGFRMLEPHELQQGMSFPTTYKFLGSKKVQVKLIGNAVTPPVATWLVGQVVKAMGA